MECFFPSALISSIALCRMVRTATLCSSDFFLTSLTRSLRRSSVSGGIERRIVAPSTSGFKPRSLVSIALRIAPTTLLSNAVTSSERPSGAFTLATAFSGRVEPQASTQPPKGGASVSAPDGRSLLVTAFDKSVVGAIRKAIETSDLGLNPNVDGATIRLSIPPLTEERRKDLVKLVKKKSEEHKVAVRTIRHKAIDEIKALGKKHSITDDEIKRGSDQVQKLTDKYIKQIDVLVHGKEKEIMEV